MYIYTFSWGDSIEIHTHSSIILNKILLRVCLRFCVTYAVQLLLDEGGVCCTHVARILITKEAIHCYWCWKRFFLWSIPASYCMILVSTRQASIWINIKINSDLGSKDTGSKFSGRKNRSRRKIVAESGPYKALTLNLLKTENTEKRIKSMFTEAANYNKHLKHRLGNVRVRYLRWPFVSDVESAGDAKTVALL